MPFLAGDRDRHSLRGSGIGGGGGDGGDGGDAHDDDRAPTHSTMMGTIPVGQRVGFDRMLFRTTRGNAYVTFSDPFDDCVDPQTGEKVPKCVFCVVYIGAAVQRRIIKMCEFFQARRYPVPENAQQVQAELKEIEQAIMEKQDVLERTISKVKEVLSHLASDTTYPQKSHLRNYQDWIRREKLVCETLKRCYTPDNSNLIRAEGWLPADQFDELNLAVRKAVQFSGAQPALVQRLYTRKSPPTYFKLDKLTTIFQGIVNTYGVPRYKEVNPGLFTIITFPFLFGVMYGDIGHGFVLFMAALLVVCNERKLLDMQRKRQLGELGSMIVGGRYLILLMGFFGFYCGLVYNDLFSIPLAVFGAKYSCCDSDNSTFKWSGDVYPFGVDPSWYNTKNELTFFNSLKMKLSVVLGVIHMVFGISLGAFNHLYFHDYVSLFGEFVPQMIFMLSTFGYMIFLILFKFTQTFPGSQAPNLIQTMIKMFLSPGSVSSDLKLYEGQGTVQAVLILLAVISMPWMLLSKPLYLRWRHKQSQPAGQPALLASRADDSPRSDSQAHEVVMDDELKVDAPPSIASSAPSAPSAAASAGASASAAGGGGGHGHGHGHGEFVFSEVFIHQAIHTIEFILGAVSNTASYLRLWALSLAHAELSNVFWEKLIMEYGVTGPSPIFALVGFGAWLGATTAVLLSMDVLECFLHALRLHWVSRARSLSLSLSLFLSFSRARSPRLLPACARGVGKGPGRSLRARR
jgi:V-type H+-transporting ATPase subunit a